MNEFDGHWITTYTGKKFHYLNPQPDEVDIKDIAHALALTCRFGGHCREYYSVAEHSIRVSNIMPEAYKLHGLLHDCGEAYLPDIPSPIKQDIPDVKKLDEKISQFVMDTLGVPNYCEDIKHFDQVLLATEARDLMPTTVDWKELPKPIIFPIEPMTWQKAEREFLAWYYFYLGIENA